MISFKHKFIYIHVPKTGGRSFLKLMKSNEFKFKEFKVSHPTWEFYKEVIDKRGLDWDDFFKFGLVRNPWDRTVSTWSYLCQKGGDKRSRIDPKDVKKYYGNFKDDFKGFVMSLLEPENLSYRHTRLQTDYMYNNEKLMLNTFFKMEDVFRIMPFMPKLNQSKRDEYQSYYDEETREVVAKVYKKDIRCLGYKYE